MSAKFLRNSLIKRTGAKPPSTNQFLLRPQRTFSSNTNAATTRLRRSVHFVPGDNMEFLSKSLSLGADTIILDLEDSVRDKASGRRTVGGFLDTLPDSEERCEVLVRINPLSGSYWQDDIESTFHNADGFMVPKVESQEELLMLDDFLRTLEKQDACKPKVLLPIATETPKAVLNIAKIAEGPRVCAITWGCEDLSAEMGAFGTRNASGYLDVFSHCRNMCLLAAKAAGVQAIDGIYQNIRDMAGFEKESAEAKYMGFDGKLTLHPTQIKALHQVFEPTEEEMKEANAIVELWEDDGDDKGAVDYGGKMIDMPHYLRAKKVIARFSGGDGYSKSGAQTKVTTEPMKDAKTQQQHHHQQQLQDSTIKAKEDDQIFPRICMGKYFEELEPGLTIRHFLTRTVTESDNVFFTCLTMNPAPIHLDHELSRGNTAALSGTGSTNNNAGKPLFNSMFTLALLVGMSVPEATHGTTVANLGFSEVKFPTPVYPGDTLRAETVVLDRRESKSRPTQGIVTLQHLAYNQRGEVVCKAVRQALMKKST
jgi:citrate lyase subunit beta/citryl-CoA lyase